jgi:hypothetical protein
MQSKRMCQAKIAFHEILNNKQNEKKYGTVGVKISKKLHRYVERLAFGFFNNREVKTENMTKNQDIYDLRVLFQLFVSFSISR